jgi:hypothetical protein
MSHLLWKAAASGNLAKVKERLAAGDDIEWRHKDTGKTALLGAVTYRHTEIIQYLLDNGADVNATDTDGNDSLAWAVITRNRKLARFFLGKVANPDFRNLLVRAAYTGDLDMVKLLLESGADPGQRNKRGETALSATERECRFPIRSSEKKKLQDVVDFLKTVEGADSPPLPDPETIAWPAVPWEEPVPTYHQDGELAPVPPDASPAQIVRGFMLARNRWNATAWQTKPGYETLERVRGEIKAAYCTDRKRAYGDTMICGGSVFNPTMEMVSEEYPKSNRCEITGIILDRDSNECFHEYCFVLFRKNGLWRLDSLKYRYRGDEKWYPLIL